MSGIPKQVWVLDRDCFGDNCHEEFDQLWAKEEGSNGSFIRWTYKKAATYPNIYEHILLFELEDDEVYLRDSW